MIKYSIVILSACLLISGIGYTEQQIVEGQKGQLSFFFVSTVCGFKSTCYNYR